MSTKIYNGFKVDVSTVEELLALTQKIRPLIEEKAEHQRKAFCSLGHLPSSQEWYERRKKIRATGLRDIKVDTDFSFTFFPAGGYFLGICYTEHNDWFDLWLAQDKVSEFGYWNGSDGPDNISEGDWEARGDLWMKLCPEVPMRCGFSIDITKV